MADNVKLPSSKEPGVARGVLIAGVLQNGPAAKAGIRPGDVILKVGTQPVSSVSELLSQVASLRPGQPASLQIWRAQNLAEIKVTPAERPSPRAVRR